MIERRASPRHRVLKRGTIAFPGGGAVDCTVRNISSSGARVDVATPMCPPESFTLLIDSDQFTRRCHAVWARDRHIGLVFESIANSPEAPFRRISKSYSDLQGHDQALYLCAMTRRHCLTCLRR